MQTTNTKTCAVKIQIKRAYDAKIPLGLYYHMQCGRLVNSSGSYQVHTHTAKNTGGVSLHCVEGVNEEQKALLQVSLHQRQTK